MGIAREVLDEADNVTTAELLADGSIEIEFACRNRDKAVLEA
jgi:hypothetical protein